VCNISPFTVNSDSLSERYIGDSDYCSDSDNYVDSDYFSDTDDDSHYASINSNNYGDSDYFNKSNIYVNYSLYFCHCDIDKDLDYVSEENFLLNTWIC